MSLLGFDAVGRLALGQVRSGVGSILLSALAGSIAETGITAAFKIALSAPVTTYAVTVNVASFATKFLSSVAAFSETGIAASFKTLFSGTAGQYVLTGLPATFSGSGAALGAGVYAVTGLPIGITVTIPASSVPYLVTTNNAALDRDHINWVWDGRPSNAWNSSGVPSSVWSSSSIPSTTWSDDPAQLIAPSEVH